MKSTDLFEGAGTRIKGGFGSKSIELRSQENLMSINPMRDQCNVAFPSSGEKAIMPGHEQLIGYRSGGLNVDETQKTLTEGTKEKMAFMVAMKSVGMFVLALLGMIIMFAVTAYANGHTLIKNITDLESLMSRTWRFFVALLDWRTNIRFMLGRRCVDVVFISNLRDAKDRKRFMGGWHPPEGHFNGPRYSIKGILGRTRVLDVTADELAKPECRIQAKEHFIRATRWAEKMGAKVVLLAAGTKRLFEGDIDALRRQFPDMFFTIGDNGTSLLLIEETLRALEKAQLQPGNCRIGVLGPYGFLGNLIIKALLGKGYDLVGAGPNNGGLEKIRKAHGIAVCRSFAEIGKVDAIVACTHSEKFRLTAENIDLIRKNGRKLLVVDVAEPSNLIYREFQQCKDRVVRQDAGNGFATGLKYVLGAVTYRMFRLSRGVTFGCFAESLTLAWAMMKHGYENEVRRMNWLEVNEENMKLMAHLFAQIGFCIPSPRSYSVPVKSFNLDIITPAIKYDH